ncbi:MAG: hypothetical protein CM1200mP35_09940 [Chloroflexota bacterium]|nr:MAG: hypothetical protein CM1200mP35_09940 [Chloroflexota bacterium]
MGGEHVKGGIYGDYPSLDQASKKKGEFEVLNGFPFRIHDYSRDWMH